MEYLYQFFTMMLTAVFIENIIFTRAFGTSRLLYLLKSPKKLFSCVTVLIIVTTAAGAIGYPLRGFIQQRPDSYILLPMFYILCIAATYTAAYFIMKRFLPKALENLGGDLGPAVFNCAVLGSLMVPSMQRLDFVSTMGTSIGMSLGFGLAVVIIGFGMKRLEFCHVPRAFKGLPVMLIYLGLLSLAFYGLVGHQLPT